MTDPAEPQPAPPNAGSPYDAPAQAGFPKPAYAQEPSSATPGGAPYDGTPYDGTPYGGRSEPRSGNPLGVVSVIVAAVVLLLGMAFLILQAGVIASGRYEALQWINIANSAISGLLGLVALIVGAIGLAQKGRPKALAGIGVGVGIAVVVGVLSGLLYTTLIAIMPR